jgi:ribosomal protein L44E
MTKAEVAKYRKAGTLKAMKLARAEAYQRWYARKQKGLVGKPIVAKKRKAKKVVKVVPVVETTKAAVAGS